jgi:predicted lipoprotein with Yx(FWY)xxD motif
MGKTKLAVLVTLVVVGGLSASAAVASTNKSSSISLRTTKVGKVLVAANGRTLYLFTGDKGRQSTCYGRCASYWPPLVGGRPTVGTGLNASLVGTTKRRDGALQVTYAGHPLYFFAPDKKAGDVNGQGYVHFGGAWWVVSPAGKKITVRP